MTHTDFMQRAIELATTTFSHGQRSECADLLNSYS